MISYFDPRGLRTGLLAACLVFLLAGCVQPGKSGKQTASGVDVAAVDRERILKAANAALALPPISITQFRAKLSEGGPNDFYSNGDYWWPDPSKPDGLPYIQRDGQSNPENFTAHRECVMKLRDAVAALAAAYRITGDDRYVTKSVQLLRVFFLDPATRMNPHLNFAQAIPGRTPGRGIGIIDTLHLAEIPLAIRAMERSAALPPDVLAGLKEWFRDYVSWMRTSKNGQEEAEARNNHSVAYWLQIAAFSQLTGDETQLAECRRRFKEVFVPKQMATDGSFPAELARTKPYGYSIFQLDNMTTLCQVLSTPSDNMWEFELPDGRGMRRAVAWMYPFLADKSQWPLKPDIQAWNDWPARQPSLLFAGMALSEPKYLQIWQRLPPDPQEFEVRRNIAITQPLLWLDPGAATRVTPIASALPRVFLLDAKHLAATRQKIRAGDARFADALAQLERDAKSALKMKPVSVMDKSRTPPSGDKHDYMSQAPYFWRDPKSPTGLPYIRRDGERNPEIYQIPDHKSLSKLEENVETLALAYYYTGNEDYAAKAAQLLRAWFLDPATRMNPNLEFAQAVPGVNTGRGTGLIETAGLPGVWDAAGLLAGSGSWTAADQRGLAAWASAFLRWMQESKHGRFEAAAKNNHGTYYDLQVVSLALFVGGFELATNVIQTVGTNRIARQIEPDGRQPLELERTRSWNYSLMNLRGLMKLATLAEHVGVDLWNYETGDGRSLRRALDFLLPYATREQKWPHPQIERWSPREFYPLLNLAAAKFRDPKYQTPLPDEARSALRVSLRTASGQIQD